MNSSSANTDERAAWRMKPDFVPGLVSVIVPTFNRVHLIIRTLDSVFAQTYRPIELIVIDDGSQDATQEVLQRWRAAHESDDFHTVLAQQPNQGAQVARNRGLAQSNGGFVQFLDSDDELLPFKLEEQVNLLEGTQAAFCYGLTELVDSQGGVSIFGAPRAPDGAWISLHAWHTNSPLFRRTVCSRVGPWNERLRGAQEYEYAARVKMLGWPHEFSEKILVRAHVHGGVSISGQKSLSYATELEKSNILLFQMLAARGPVDPVEARQLAVHLVEVALRYARGDDDAGARRCLVQAVRMSPRSGRRTLQALEILSRLVPSRPALEAVRFSARLLRMTINPFRNVSEGRLVEDRTNAQ